MSGGQPPSAHFLCNRISLCSVVALSAAKTGRLQRWLVRLVLCGNAADKPYWAHCAHRARYESEDVACVALQPCLHFRQAAYER